MELISFSTVGARRYENRTLLGGRHASVTGRSSFRRSEPFVAKRLSLRVEGTRTEPRLMCRQSTIIRRGKAIPNRSIPGKKGRRHSQSPEHTRAALMIPLIISWLNPGPQETAERPVGQTRARDPSQAAMMPSAPACAPGHGSATWARQRQRFSKAKSLSGR